MATKIMAAGDDDGILETSPDGRFVKYDEVLGKGAFKVVYKGFDQDSGYDVAWCQIKIDEAAVVKSSFADNLLSEANLMKSLEHENIAKCHSWWVDRGSMNINMITELFTSGTLRQYRNKHKSVNMKAIKNWGVQILKGLSYLHSHDPPVVHRDLKCDNIFVNGNNGQVKIGDLGLATLRQHHRRLVTVLGTPEFMAPELYEEDYDELVDIYSFGMCMLELVTCEYPYSECNNVAQIFKKVTTGVKPLSLGKLQDPQMKALIDKCLLPASQRPSAAELLKDPFFTSSTKKSTLEENNLPEFQASDSASTASSSGSSSSLSSVGSVWSATSSSPVSTAESFRSTTEVQFRLRGKRIDVNTISFNLYILDKRSLVGKSFEFDFDLKADDALKVALEMVDGDELSYHQVPIAAELIDCVVLELEPNWITCPGFHHELDVSSGCNDLSSTQQIGVVVH
ncbi:OLC1v1027357C1 [Oldenlandia corymbosa var. corymbosa]|uniref:non-specific serine/threonine protein kinase n=1 Tax=Oldenlandia corymbosa var. corymbosa TaxID=529605 RepID=A0AAV1CCI4_OLDCO|nr:OLC1v1027357C1 [Oldenlandia corymbosa var. corymbosa]